MKIFITGGAGFIGSELVRQCCADTAWEVVNIDALTYAGNLDSLTSVMQHPRYQFEMADICNAARMAALFAQHEPDGVIHLAAESHVDRSIDGPAAFMTTNILGTFTLLEAATAYWRGLPATRRDGFRFHHVSTDEVFGSLDDGGRFDEESRYQPNSPYAASKASADHLVRAWHRTYGLPVVVTNCSNNYGPYQFPEKLIPLVILNALEGRRLPVYGDGRNVRDWLYVGDHARALRRVFEAGAIGETYNVGGHSERTNLAVVETICAILDELRPLKNSRAHSELIEFVADRPGHDRRYAIDCAKLERELGWAAEQTFESGLRATVNWYLRNAEWCQRVQSGVYRRERLGLTLAS